MQGRCLVSREKSETRENGRRTVCREIALVFDECMRNSLLKLAQRRRLSLLGKLWKLIRADYYILYAWIPPRSKIVHHFSNGIFLRIWNLKLTNYWLDRVFLVEILFFLRIKVGISERCLIIKIVKNRRNVKR